MVGWLVDSFLLVWMKAFGSMVVLGVDFGRGGSTEAFGWLLLELIGWSTGSTIGWLND